MSDEILTREQVWTGKPPDSMICGSAEYHAWHAENERRSAIIAWKCFHERRKILTDLNRACGRKAKRLKALRADRDEWQRVAEIAQDSAGQWMLSADSLRADRARLLGLLRHAACTMPYHKSLAFECLLCAAIDAALAAEHKEDP